MMIRLKSLLFEQYNSNVELVQKKLQDLEYNLGPKGADGILGKFTLAALEKYKTVNGLTGNATDTEVLKSLTGQDINLSSQLTAQGSGTSEFESFKTKLASALGITLTSTKSQFFDAWAKVENTKATNNPFATTLNYKKDSDMTKFNLANRGQGVKNFSTLDHGVAATAITMKLSYYKTLIAKLQNDDITAMELAQDSSLDKWGTGSRKVQKLLGNTTPNNDSDNTSKSELDRIIKINKDIESAWDRLYKVTTENPEKYFSKFKDLLDDNELGASIWFAKKFYNPMAGTFSAYKSDIENMKSVNGKDYVLQNIDRLNEIAKLIYDYIKTGKRGTLNTEYTQFVYFKDGKWYDKPYKFKWTYM